MDDIQHLLDATKIVADLGIKLLRKSQMAFDFHHAAYDRTDPRTGKLEHIEAHGQQHHVVPQPSPVIEQPQEGTVNAIKTKKELIAALQEADGQTLYSGINATGSSRERFYIKRDGQMQIVHRSAVDAARDKLKLVRDYPSGSQWKLKKPQKQVPEPPIDTNLREQLEAYKATLAAQYVEQATATFARFKATYGPDLRGKGPDGYTLNNGKYGKVWDKYRGMTQRDANNEVHLLDYAVKDAGERYAEATVEAWHDKIIGKVKDLQNTTVHRLNGYIFIITGERDGKKITIEQNMIINRSTNGLLFNQFPSRIYVDGKFHSEAAYKKVTGDDAVERAAKEKTDAEKRAKNMLPSRLFAKYDKVQIKLVRKDGSKYEIEGTVTTERNDKTVVRAGSNRFNMKDYAIETGKLARWNGKVPEEPQN